MKNLQYLVIGHEGSFTHKIFSEVLTKVVKELQFGMTLKSLMIDSQHE